MNLREIWANAWKSLLNDKTGFAIKKTIAALYCAVVVILCFMYTDKTNFLAVLAQLLGFILIVLGIRAKEKKDKLNSEKDEANDAVVEK